MRAAPFRILVLLLLVCAASAARAATLPPGFQETIVIQGRTNPTAIRFGPAGQIFVAEKSGLVLFYESFEDPTPTQVVDLRAQVHNFWDRGLLGLAIHPNFPATPYIYVLYAHDTWPPGDPRFGNPAQPRWGTGTPTPSTADPCPTPPGATGDGCVVFGRLSRINVNPVTMVGSEQVMLQGNWCQQYPSHSTGDLVFGGDGYLYVSAGDGASFNFADWGQDGSPVNPCGDPPDGLGGPNSGLNAEGGALRSQDILTPATASDPTSFGGTVLRLDVSTQPPTAPATNPLVGNGIADDDFIAAIGLRNPFRINQRPGTNEIWITDVGWSAWEEINRIEDPTGTVENFGWPCYEGDNVSSLKLGSYQNRTLCRRLYGEVGPPIPSGIQTVAPYYAYHHNVKVVPGELCGTGSSSATGILFNTGGDFPPDYDGALFFADSSRQCVWTLFAGPGGLPNKADIAPLVSQASGRVVDIQMAADGRLYYVDFDNGRIYRVEYFLENQPPIADIDASPTSGIAPLEVHFDASDSSDAEDGTNLIYAWDLDGDGQYDDSTLAAPIRTYTQAGTHSVSLRVEDTWGDFDVATVQISVDNTPPVASIDAPSPSFLWSVGESIDYALSATDLQDGSLPGSQLSLQILMHHCDAPTDCHTHALTTSSGAAGGSFLAPDHEYPSHLELRLTATDLPPANWFDTAWAVRRRLTFDNAAQPEGLSDFPVLVTLNPSRIDYAQTQPGGADLRFASASGALLSHEIEVWNPSGVSRVWVRVPSIAAASAQDHIFVYYGNPAASDAQDPAGVWSNGYAAVWHLHGDLLDSSGNGNHGTNNGSTNAAGQVGDGQGFDGSSWIHADSTPSLSLTGELSLEAWTSLSSTSPPGSPRVLSKKNVWTDGEGYNLEQKPTESNVTTLGSGSDYIRADGLEFGTSWHYLASTVGGGSGRVYFDGADRTTDEILSPLVAGPQPLNIGRASAMGDYFFGSIDEVRISNVARSASWIAAQYLSMTDAFITYGPETGTGTLSDVASVLLYPRTVELEFETLPPGLSLALGGDTATAPFSHTVIVGSNNSVSALTPQVQGQESYEFAAWSDAGAVSHLIEAPTTPTTYTAIFAAAPACRDGFDDDGDTLIDLADPGCANADDPSEQSAEIACDDGQDNDGDTLVDLADTGCAGAADTSEQNAAVACDDGQDNDGDTLADHADPGCANATDASEQNTAVVCDDGQDNDGDTLADHADPGCANATDASEQNTATACDDGQDNDGDLLVDHADPGCASPADTSEQNTAVACDDGQDNDGDLLVDLADAGCASPADTSEQNSAIACDDGQDNDGDLLVDLADPGCANASDASETNAAVACDDGLDNDGDALADHADPGCANATDPSEHNAAIACDDGLDNDLDTLADLADPGCESTIDASETNAAVACDDGQDNDGDALVDHADPGCENATDPSEQNTGVACDDGQDNDGDALVDLADPGCEDHDDASEQNAAIACDDGEDNDGDALTDLADPGCEDAEDASEQNAAVACDDGVDNDGDTLVDLADPGCEDAIDASETNASVACDDGVDNDGDGPIDWPADSDCTSASDDSESPPEVPALPPLGVAVLVAALLGAARRLPISSSRSRCSASFTRIK